jgi:hypothetical protein
MKKVDQERLAAEAQLKQLQQKYEMLRKIITAEGFYQTWFNSLPNFNSGAAAFNNLNEIHYNLTLPHKYKYSSYSIFLTVIGRKKTNK